MRTISLTALFALSAMAANAFAGPLPNMNGSDTLELVTKDILAACRLGAGIPTTEINYVGGGSGTGESEMLAGRQQIAPMSRFFNAAACDNATYAATAEDFVFAKDALSIVADENSSAGGGGVRFETGPALPLSDVNGVGGIQCGGVACSNPASYAFRDWRDALRVLFAGMHQNDGNTLTNQNCNSDVRHLLVSKYANLFQTPGGLNQAEPLRHAFRRDDLSGTTDTFISLLGLPGITQPPNTLPLTDDFPFVFCNGADFQDRDPIRRACDPNEEVCNWNVSTNTASLGVVLPISVPPDTAGTPTYNVTACTPSVFKWMFAPKRWTLFPGPTPGPTQRKCPNNTTIQFAKCLTPVLRTGVSPNFVFTGGCLAASTGKPFGSPASFDGRKYNLTPRKAGINGDLFTTSRPAPLGPPTGNYKDFESGFYRIHSTKVLAGGLAPCTLVSSTDQIGCLTAASPWSAGFAGREAAGLAGVDGLLVNNVDGSVDANILSGLYPLSRNLWINTARGFETITAGPELDLAKCFAGDPSLIAGGFATVRTLVSNRGFIPVPAPTCMSCSGTACGNNAAPFPGNPENPGLTCVTSPQPACVGVALGTACGGGLTCKTSGDGRACSCR